MIGPQAAETTVPEKRANRLQGCCTATKGGKRTDGSAALQSRQPEKAVTPYRVQLRTFSKLDKKGAQRM